MKLLVRVDGDSGKEAGLGHVVRSLEIVRMLKEKIPRLDVLMLMRNFKEGVQKVLSAGHEVKTLSERPTTSEYEKAFSEFEPDLTIIDTLGYDTQQIVDLRRYNKKIITLDDLSVSATRTDMIVNGILFATRQLSVHEDGPLLFQGVEYIILRDEFNKKITQYRDLTNNIARIFLSSGGSDMRDMTCKVIKQLSLALNQEVEVTAVVGAAYLNDTHLLTLRDELDEHFVCVKKDASHIVDLMYRSDLAIISGGNLLFEAMSVGLPSIVCSTYEHQAPAAKYFMENDSAIYLGDIDASLDSLCDTVKMLKNNAMLRESMSKRGQALVDGKGLERLVQHIECLAMLH